MIMRRLTLIFLVMAAFMAVSFTGAPKGNGGFIYVSKQDMMLYLYDSTANLVMKTPIACARAYGNKKSMYDGRTPEGVYTVLEAFDSRNKPYTTDDGRVVYGVYGPYFVRLNHPISGNAIGIHGTGTPSSIGKRCSHGCIRVHNDSIAKIYPHVYKGMPVIISPSIKDIQADQAN